MRAPFLIENLLRTLDPEFRILDSLLEHGSEKVGSSLSESSGPAALARLKHEAALTLQDLPTLVGAWLHRAQRERAGIPVMIKVDGLETASRRLDRAGNRLALALVTLGLYVAASLLMQHSIGPRLVGGLTLLAALGYALALWFTFRLAAGIARSGRL